jgi:hypothetical protein
VGLLIIWWFHNCTRSPTWHNKTRISVAQWPWQALYCLSVWFELSCVPSTWRFNCCGSSWTCSAFFSGFDPLRARLSLPRCLTYSWACRMSSGPWGIVVVCVSWPGHPTWIKKKKNSVTTVLMELWITPGWWNWSENTCKFYGTRHSLMRQFFFPFLSMHSTNLLLSNMPIFASWWKAMVRTFWELSLDQ